MNLKQSGRETWQRTRSQIDGPCNSDLVKSIPRMQYNVCPLTYTSGTLNGLFHGPPPQFECFFFVPLHCRRVCIFKVLKTAKTCNVWPNVYSGRRSRYSLFGFSSLESDGFLDAQRRLGDGWLIFDWRWPAESLGRRFGNGLCPYARRRCTNDKLRRRGSS